MVGDSRPDEPERDQATVACPRVSSGSSADLYANAAGRRRVESLLFTAALVVFSYFHQGGGWAQNARFALVRSIVEQGRLSIDSYLIYRAASGEEGAGSLRRVPVEGGRFSLEARAYELGWRDARGHLVPIDSSPSAGAAIVPIDGAAVSEDIAFHRGHFFPNKPPGTSFLAVPAYFALYRLERLAGNDPDDWWRLTLNAWLTSVLSVGLLAAATCVVFFRLSSAIWEEGLLPALLATITFACGTMFLPYATMLAEHDVVVAAFVIAIYCLWTAKSDARSRSSLLVLMSGICMGYAAITNYVAAMAMLVVGAYVLLAVKARRGWLWYGVGASVPVLFLCAYQWACFGSPWATSYAHESPVFQSSGNLLGVFTQPRGDVLLSILFSPFRGLFFSSPVLLVGVAGLVRLSRRSDRRAEVVLFAVIIGMFVAFNISFNGWHGGWATGPRYLVPAVPFLALGTVFGFARYFKSTSLLAAISIAVMVLSTAVDPQSPLGVDRIARVPDRPQWRYDPLTEYELPLFLAGQAGPPLQAALRAALRGYERKLAAGSVAADQRAAKVTAARRKLEEEIARGDPATFLLASFRGPVSVNPVGMYEAWFYRIFPPASVQSRWNSFNVGEFLFPESRWSIVPLLVASVALFGAALRTASELDRGGQGTGA